MIKKNTIGVYNVGTERKNMHELAVLTKDDVKPTTIFPHESTPEDVSMNISKMERKLKVNDDDWWALDEDK